MTDKRIDLLKNQPIPKAVTKLALPAIAGMIIMAVYNAVDAMFVSWLGTESAGAIQVAFPMMMVITALSALFAIGSSTYISRLLGQGDIKRANKVASTAIFIVISVSILTMSLAFVFLNDVLRFFGASENVLPFARQYIVFILAGMVFQMSNMALNSMLRSEGSAVLSMIGMAVGAVLNIILDPIFIFVLGLGIKGAAIATSLSAMVSFAVLLTPYLKKKSVLHIKIRNFSPDKIMMREIFKIGTPSLFRQLLASVAVGVLNQMATRYGGDAALAGMGLMSRVMSIAIFVVFGFSQGFQPVAGYNYGAKRYDRLRQSVRFTILVSTVITTLTAFVFGLFPQQIMSVFRAQPEVADIAVTAFRYISVTLPFFGYAVTITVLFQAIGRALPAALLSLARQGIFFFPIVFILPKLLGITGVILTQPAADFFTLILTFILGLKVTREIRRQESQMPAASPDYDVAV